MIIIAKAVTNSVVIRTRPERSGLVHILALLILMGAHFRVIDTASIRKHLIAEVTRPPHR